ncbi:hypothetical protein Q4553_13190 [Tenacibaculum soleae]|uniref:hypothetical protein n=1 Tax=Tenacibaculum soleae TaxID=447689 RepID=UPI0026E43987|nr:hypothetical protein [Tenacibaculum soleae]MDO6745523.1 hypothetical protein [Tenacibaculum soleae]
MKEYLERLKHAKSDIEINNILDEIVPLLRREGISPSQVMMYFKMNGNDFVPKSQDHRMTHSNSGKAEEILRKLMEKLKA